MPSSATNTKNCAYHPRSILKQQRSQKLEREALESTFKLRGDRLREDCNKRAGSFRREHEARLAEALEQRTSASGDARKTHATPRELLPSTVCSSASPPTVYSREIDRVQDQNHQQHQPPKTAGRSPAVAVADHGRTRGLVELRGKLARHLAIAHEDGRHLEQATGVMQEIEELEAKARLETEVCHLGRAVGAWFSGGGSVRLFSVDFRKSRSSPSNVSLVLRDTTQMIYQPPPLPRIVRAWGG